MARVGENGFTLVELLVTIAVMSFLVVAVTPRFWNFLNTYQLDADTQDLVQLLRLAQNKAMQSEASAAYSVHLVSGDGGSFTLYQGSDFASRDTAYDEEHDLPASLRLTYTTSDADITFSKIEGTTTDTGTITLSWPDGGKSWVINLNAAGRVDIQ